MFQSLHSRAGIGVGVGATGALTMFLTLGIAAPAAQANGAAPARLDGATVCPIQRIGTQLVHCDNLSGAGVAARPSIPLWQAHAPLSNEPASLPSLPPRMNRGMF